MKIIAKITVIKEDNGLIEVIEDNMEIKPTSVKSKTERGKYESEACYGFTVKITEDIKTKEAADVKCKEM